MRISALHRENNTKGKEQMANIRLAPVLRPLAGGAKIVSAEGNTLGEVLANLYQRHAALKEQIQPEEELSRFVNVYVNDQDVRYLQGLATSVGPNDTVTLLPAMAGGSCGFPTYTGDKWPGRAKGGSLCI
jgi:molybdopterin converting factor small subunit